MKERVLEAIYKKLEEDPENENLQRQITLLNMASICTIDSFCLEVVKNNFYELENVSPNFRIADTPEIELLKQEILDELFENPKAPSEIIEEKGWVQISDEGAIKEVVLKILENNPQSVADYKAGKDRALGFLVGQAMKETKGKANPQMLNKMFIEELTK